MAITVSGTTITFNDGTTQSTAASAASTTYGAVGTYTFATLNNGIYTAWYYGGDTFPGAYIWPTGVTNSNASGVQVLDFVIGTTYYSGTWKLMALSRNPDTMPAFGNGRMASLYVRIA